MTLPDREMKVMEAVATQDTETVAPVEEGSVATTIECPNTKVAIIIDMTKAHGRAANHLSIVAKINPRRTVE